MGQKITLSIPDMLHEKLEEFRASFNLSKMFQEAVTEAIQKKEKFQKRFSDEFELTDVIRRLKAEKEIWEKKIYKLGKSEGLQWAKTARYEILLYVLQFTEPYQLASDSKMNRYFEHVYQTTDLAVYSKSGRVDPEHSFLDGWHQGVMEFWNQVKGEL